MEYIVDTQTNLNEGKNDCPVDGAELRQLVFYEEIPYRSYEEYRKKTGEHFLKEGFAHKVIDEEPVRIARKKYINEYVIDIDSLEKFAEKNGNFIFCLDKRRPFPTLVLLK